MTNPLVFEYLKNSYLKLFPSIFPDYIFESESIVLKSSIFTDVLPFIWSVSETPPCLIRSCYVDERDAAGAPDPFTALQRAMFYKAVVYTSKMAMSGLMPNLNCETAQILVVAAQKRPS